MYVEVTRLNLINAPEDGGERLKPMPIPSLQSHSPDVASQVSMCPPVTIERRARARASPLDGNQASRWLTVNGLLTPTQTVDDVVSPGRPCPGYL